MYGSSESVSEISLYYFQIPHGESAWRVSGKRVDERKECCMLSATTKMQGVDWHKWVKGGGGATLSPSGVCGVRTPSSENVLPKTE